MQGVAAVIRKGLRKPGKGPQSTFCIAHEQIEWSQQIAFARAIVDEPVALLFAAQGAFIATNPGSDLCGGLRQVVHVLAPGQGGLWRLATSRRVAIIVAQQPAQAIATPHLAAVAPKAWLGCNELIAETLMIPLGMIMRQILLDHIGQ